MTTLKTRLLILGALTLLVFELLPTAAWSVDNRPIVVLRIDDCQTSWLTPFNGLGGVSAFNYGKQKRIPITWAVISSFASSGTSMTWAQMLDYLHTCGGEPASHSVNHAAMPTQQSYIDEVVASKAAIEANLPGYQCNTFLQPGTWTGDAYMDNFDKLDNPIGRAIQANYSQSMAYLGQGWRIGNTYYSYGMTNAYSIDAQSNPTIAGIDNTLDVVANTPGLVLVISGHGVQEQGKSVAYNIPADILKATMDKLADLRDQGRIRLMSLHDAFHTRFSDDVNHVPDSGIEVVDTTVTSAPWRLTGSASFAGTGGLNDSRYCSLSDKTGVLGSTGMTLPPGRYELSWYQKVLGGRQNSGLVVVLAAMNQGALIYRVCMDWAFFYNASPGIWEKKTALIIAPDRLNIDQLVFQPATDGGYGVDNISIVSSPVDPAVSPSGTSVDVSPGKCRISWHTPGDPSVTTVSVRYGSTTHPTNATSGTLLATSTPAYPNSTQQVTLPLDWTTRNYLFFSVFANKPGSDYAPPDIAVVKVDKTPPSVPAVTLTTDPDGTIHVQWISLDPDSQIYQYRYAVGTSTGDDSIVRWTYTTEPSTTISGLRFGSSVYVSVQAQNQFGLWSDIGFAMTCPPSDIGHSCALPDGSLISSSGAITAVFADCAYIQTGDRSRGIKIVGDVSSYHEGDYVQIEGVLSTRDGERCVVIE